MTGPGTYGAVYRPGYLRCCIPARVPPTSVYSRVHPASLTAVVCTRTTARCPSPRRRRALGSVLPVYPGWRVLRPPGLLFPVTVLQSDLFLLPGSVSCRKQKIGCCSGNMASGSLGTSTDVRDGGRHPMSGKSPDVREVSPLLTLLSRKLLTGGVLAVF